jgi:hypothetical protein
MAQGVNQVYKLGLALFKSLPAIVWQQLIKNSRPHGMKLCPSDTTLVSLTVLSIPMTSPTPKNANLVPFV